MTNILAIQQVQVFIAVSSLISLITAIAYFINLYLAKRQQQSQKGFVMQIIPPKYSTEELLSKQGIRFSLQRFFDNLTASLKDDRISLEVYADNDGIKFFIWTPTKQIQNLIKLNLYTTYKERIKIKTLDTDVVDEFKAETSIINEYKSKKHDVYMLMDVKDFEGMDPIQDLLCQVSIFLK